MKSVILLIVMSMSLSLTACNAQIKNSKTETVKINGNCEILKRIALAGYDSEQFLAPDNVYYQHCPMFNDGKGVNWLSKESTIKNPYYGSQMLGCGKIVETIQ